MTVFKFNLNSLVKALSQSVYAFLEIMTPFCNWGKIINELDPDLQFIFEKLTQNINQAEPYFQIFPFYYQTNTALREYKEKRYILIWKSPLNLNKT